MDHLRPGTFSCRTVPEVEWCSQVSAGGARWPGMQENHVDGDDLDHAVHAVHADVDHILADMKPVRIPCEGVLLRPHTESDIPGIVDQCTDAQSRAWSTVPEPYTRDDAERFLEQVVRAGWEAGTSFHFAIADPATDEFLGSINLHTPGHARAASDTMEIGYGLRELARGRRAASTATRAVLDWGFDQLGLNTVLWQALVGNWASRRVAWSAGFRVEGQLRDWRDQRGRRSDAWLGSIRRADPRRPAHPWFEPAVLLGSWALRPFRKSDVPAVTEACADPVTQHWLGHMPSPYGPDDAREFIRTRDDEHASGRGLYWAVAEPETDRCVASIGIGSVNVANGSAEVGYWVHPEARGRGVATSSLRAVVRHAALPTEDGGLGLHRLILRAATANEASARVAEKVGFERVGIERAFGRLGDGSMADHLLYDVVLSDVLSEVDLT